MNKLIASLVAVVATSNPALANVHQQHIELYNAVESVGVEVVMNPSFCEKNENGSYRWKSTPRDAIIVICQDNSKPGGPVVEWTPNDLDTLRHEAHHLVQDCLVGMIADNKTGTLFEGKQLKEFIANSITPEKFKWIVKNYGDRGASNQVILRELEAFAVAQSVDASAIADAVNELCKYKM